MNIKETVYRLIKNIVGDEISFDDDSLLKEDLGIDSFKAINLLYELQANSITLKSYDMDTILTVRDLIKALKHE